MIVKLPNGRAFCSSQNLTPAQYRAVVAQPQHYFSEKNRTFSFVPTPYGMASLAESGLQADADLSEMAQRWLRFANRETHCSKPILPRYASVLNKNPWDHQDSAIDFAVHCPSPYFDMGMGVGKSLCTIATLAACNHKRTLILCPKAVVGVWPREFRKHSRGDFIVVPLDQSTCKKKVEEADKWMRLNPSGKMVFICNYESAIQEVFAKWCCGINWDCVVCDEIHKIKSPTGAAARLCASIPRGHPLGLSGTMLPHDPLDVWSQYRFLDAAIFGTSFTMFKRKYCELGIFNEVRKFIGLDELHQKINLIRHHVPSTVLGLPPVTHNEYRFSLSPTVKKAYDKFKKELFTELQGGIVTAANVLVRGLRLQQLTSGFFIDDATKECVPLDDRPKIAAFQDWLDSVPKNKKAVVFVRFKHDADAVLEVIQKAGLRSAELSGRRNDLTSDATFPPDADILVANIASGGVGVDLTAASYGCYYSISWNRGEYDQSIARLNRPGQNDHVTFAHLIADDTIDPEIYAAFEEGRDLVQAVLSGLS
jgi:SNF2 family DNA or RNA helicase